MISVIQKLKEKIKKIKLRIIVTILIMAVILVYTYLP